MCDVLALRVRIEEEAKKAKIAGNQPETAAPSSSLMPASYLQTTRPAFIPYAGSSTAAGISGTAHQTAQTTSGPTFTGLGSVTPGATPAERLATTTLINTHIAAMKGLSPNAKKRITPTVTLHPRKPSSPQYQYAKSTDNFTPAERIVLSAGLEEIIKGGSTGDPTNTTPDEAVDMWLSVQYARLRVHTKEQREKYHKEQIKKMNLPVPVLGQLSYALDRISGLDDTAAERKTYYRSEDRPEYAVAFNAFMEMLSAPEVSDVHKLKIAKELLDQHIRKEGTIAPRDVNHIIAALPGGQQAPRPGHTVSKPPRKTADDTALYRAIIRLARGGYRTGRGAREVQARTQEMANERTRQLAQARNAKKLHLNVQHTITEANRARQQSGLPPLPLPPNPWAFNNVRNAEAFSKVLELIDDPVNQTARIQVNAPGVKAALYQNAAQIILAIWQYPDLRRRIFDDSVGGLGHCNNNVLDVFTRLANQARLYFMLADIRSGTLTVREFARASMQQFRLETLENYVAQHLVPLRPDQTDYQPEMSLYLKSELKDDLDLPDSVIKVALTPWNNWQPDPNDIPVAENFVQSAAFNFASLSAFFLTDPIWREGLVALVERDNPNDAQMLHAYTKMVPGVINTPSATLAQQAWNDLNSLYTPVNDKGKYNDLCARIQKLEKEFSAARADVEKQLAEYMMPYLVPDSIAKLPDDGNFIPTFVLPADWLDELEKLQSETTAAEIEELEAMEKTKQAEIAGIGKRAMVLVNTHNDFRGMNQTQIDSAMSAMAARREQIKAAKSTAENREQTNPPSDGMIALNTIEMEIERKKTAVRRIQLRLHQLKSAPNAGAD